MNGVATFSNLSINNAGSGYTLVANSGALTFATSNTFNITTSATQLAFVTEPTTTAAGTSINPSVQVAVQDALGNTDPTFTGNVTVAIGANPGSGALSGTATQAAVAGVATFADLSIDKAGTGYTLSATSGALPAGTSAAFNITPGAATKLVFTVQPSAVGAGLAISPAVHLIRTVRSTSDCQDEEIFGPDVAVYVVDDIDDAVALADRTRFGLALSVFSRRRRNLEPFFRGCRVGVLNWNRATVGASSALPFGGQRASGNDRPSALFATDYCAYPVAMLPELRGPQAPPPPGFPSL